MTNEVGGIAADRLRSIIERIERLEEEKAEIAEQIKQVKLEARAAGFDGKVISAIIRERKLTEADRREYAELLELYRAALGMLDGTPLGDAAKARLSKPMRPAPASPAFPTAEPDPADAAPPPPVPPSPEDVLAARAQGAAAALAGKPVGLNPFPAGDARRASWDEGWCSTIGSDGMDIPAAFRRTAPKKPGKGDGKGTGA